MEQKFKEFKEFYEKNGGSFFSETDNEQLSEYRFDEYSIDITEEVRVNTIMSFDCFESDSYGKTCVFCNIYHSIVVRLEYGFENNIDLNISTPAELSELITTLKKYLK